MSHLGPQVRPLCNHELVCVVCMHAFFLVRFPLGPSSDPHHQSTQSPPSLRAGRRPEAATKAKGAPEAGSIAAAVAGPSTVFHYKQIELDTLHGIALFDITPQVREAIAEAGVKEGFAIVLSR